METKLDRIQVGHKEAEVEIAIEVNEAHLGVVEDHLDEVACKAEEVQLKAKGVIEALVERELKMWWMTAKLKTMIEFLVTMDHWDMVATFQVDLFDWTPEELDRAN